MHSQRGNSSVGRARPCQGRGREFKSRFPLHKDDSKGHPFLLQAWSGGQEGLAARQGLGSAPEGSHFRPGRMARKVIYFGAGRVGLRGRISLPPPRAVPQPVFNRHQIDLRECFGTAPPPTTISVASRRGKGGFWTVFGTATLPTGTSVASSRGEGGFWPVFGTANHPTGTPVPSLRGEATPNRCLTGL